LRNLAAQGWLSAEGSIQAGSGDGTDGRESEPWEIIYCKPCKTQIPIIEQTIEDGGFDAGHGQVARLLSGHDLRGLRGGANLDNEDTTVPLQSMSRFFKFLPGEQILHPGSCRLPFLRARCSAGVLFTAIRPGFGGPPAGSKFYMAC
jgi:hypothetical protein